MFNFRRFRAMLRRYRGHRATQRYCDAVTIQGMIPLWTVDMTVEEEFNYTVVTLVNLAQEMDVGTVQQISIHVQASGEYPYSLTLSEEPLPHAGLASNPSTPGD